MGYIVASKIIL